MHEIRSVQPRAASPIVGLAFAGLLTGILWVAMAVVSAQPASAAPARPVVNKFTQPDGSTFTARLYGDEWSNGYETLRGYTIIKNKQSGYWEYAVRNDGRLVASGRRAGHAAPSGLHRHLREKLSGRVAVAARSHSRFAQDSPNVGSQPALVLLVDYSNQVHSTTVAQWKSKFFGSTGSVNDYYDEVSYDQLDLPPAAETSGTDNNGVVGWLRLSGNHPNTQGSINWRNRKITRKAIIASDPYVNYASFDTDSSNSITKDELHITVIVAGHETSYGGPGQSCGNAVWGHNWGLLGAEIPTADGKRVAAYADGGGYNQFGEKHCWSRQPSKTHIATIGIMVHEMGHDLNLPDLYDTNPANGDSYGVGEWSVMAAGSWTFTGSNFEGSSPVHMDAFSKWYEGWLTPTQITGTQTGVQLTEMTNNADIYQLLDNPGSPRPVDWTFNVTSGTGEYFLVENRQQTGYDAGLPGCGLLIYHIDETRRSDNLANANETRRLVDVEEADGLNELDNDSDLEQGDAGDPYRGPKFFDRTSNPNSNLYSSAWSGVTVNNVSATCAPTMSADISVEEVPTFDLTVTKSGTGTGSVSSSPEGISCGDSCIKEYVGGIVVTLTATPTNGSKFVEWSDACTGNGPCRVTMDAAKSVTATFIGKTTTTLTVSKTASKVKAKGSVKPAHAEDQVKITLYKRRSNGTWRRLATKTDTLNASSVYAKSFNRPNGGRCKMKTKFAADGDHLGSKVTKKFRC